MTSISHRRRRSRMSRAKARAEFTRKLLTVIIKTAALAAVIICMSQFYLYEKDNISNFFAKKAAAQTPDETLPPVPDPTPATPVNAQPESEQETESEPETETESTPAESQSRVDPDRPMVAFTFDDGPYAPVDNRILDLMETYDGRVTFFIVGNRIQDYPTTLKRIHESGCEIANHSYEHKNLEKLTPEEVFMQIELTNEYLDQAIGARTQLVRVPYGAYGGEVPNLVTYPIIQWNVDTEDWKSKDKASIVDQVLTHVKDGSIVLMHDLYPTTADALEEVVPILAEQGYQFVTVSELYQARGLPMEPGKVYFNAPKS